MKGEFLCIHQTFVGRLETSRMIVFANSASIGMNVAVQICMMMRMSEEGDFSYDR